MGRRARLRGPVERAIVELLADGPMRAVDLLNAVERRTGASTGTIRKWGRPLCDVEKRGQPGYPDAGWWWCLTSKGAGKNSKITATARRAPTTPKGAGIGGHPDDAPKAGSALVHEAVRARLPKTVEKDPPSLLVDQSRSQRQAVINTFATILGRWRLDAVTLTTVTGYPSASDARAWAEAVAQLGGGCWLAPHVVESTEHRHGMIVGVDPATALSAWPRLAGSSAALDRQDTRPVDDLHGWLNYCRGKPGFDPRAVIATGRLRDPWIWALGRVGYKLPEPHIVSTEDLVRAVVALGGVPIAIPTLSPIPPKRAVG